ncbi:PQQ-dependent sugar dehydrogenase [Gordonia caeni]|uniref:PQQ-dependent sugar dehydrogenase n=1 Tax=Gordonia caeni TaxID=1007097 RepID=A0ABP7PLJ5_9ACTN
MTIRIRPVGAAILLLLGALLTACGDGDTAPESTAGSAAESSAATAPSPGAPAEPTVITTALEAPWSIVFYGETPLVSERDSGRIVELDASGAQREVARLDGVQAGGEGGLLGLAVHEDHVYAYYTGDGENRIERFAIEGEPGALRLSSPETVLDGIPAAHVHNGGRLAFGPDGMLYATTGDANDPELAQERDSLGGKILRMSPDGEVPQDNPFPGQLTYSFGHRNPQGLTWAPDGTMYAAEFGQNTWDELNEITAGGNYGWPQAEGAAGRTGLIDPVQQWGTSEASPSGITVFGDQLVIANLRGQRLRAVPLADTAESAEYLDGEAGRLRDVAVAPDGSLWVLTNNTDGRGDPSDGDDKILRLQRLSRDGAAPSR